MRTLSILGLVDLEDAIINGEIIAVNSIDVTNYQPKVEANQPVIINQGSSLADEILKLKTLRDEGILTEEEFEKAKALLINGGGE